MPILIIEDSPDVFWMLKLAFENLHQQVVCAKNVLEAGDAWKKEVPSCIILDLNLRGIISEEIPDTSDPNSVLEGWEWLVGVVLRDDPSFRYKVIIYSDYIAQLREKVAEAELDGIEIVEKRDPNCTSRVFGAIERITGLSA